MRIDHKLPLGGVGMASADVLGLEMLHLGEDVVTVTHFRFSAFTLSLKKTVEI